MSNIRPCSTCDYYFCQCRQKILSSSNQAEIYNAYCRQNRLAASQQNMMAFSPPNSQQYERVTKIYVDMPLSSIFLPSEEAKLMDECMQEVEDFLNNVEKK